GFFAYSGRDRPLAVSGLPGDPVAAIASADPGGDRVYRGSFVYSDCLRLQLCAERAVVSAADRNADRDFYCVHGAREYCVGWDGSAVDDCVRVWAGSWLRLLVRASGESAVRRISFADVA